MSTRPGSAFNLRSKTSSYYGIDEDINDGHSMMYSTNAAPGLSKRQASMFDRRLFAHEINSKEKDENVKAQNEIELRKLAELINEGMDAYEDVQLEVAKNAFEKALKGKFS